MKPYLIDKNEYFIGRAFETHYLSEIAETKGAKIIIVYGRRRVGKTELLEQIFRDRNLIKFEGLENLSPTEQQHFVMQQLAEYAEEPLLAKVQVSDWSEVLHAIADKVRTGKWTLYFEELQWLA